MTELEYWMDKLYKLAFPYDPIAEYCDRLRLKIEERYIFLNESFGETKDKKSCDTCSYGSFIRGGSSNVSLGYLCSINKKVGLEILPSCRFWESIIRNEICNNSPKRCGVYKLNHIRKFNGYSMIRGCVEKENEILAHKIAELMFSNSLEDKITMEILIRKQEYVFYISNNYKIIYNNIYTRDVQMIFTYFKIFI